MKGWLIQEMRSLLLLLWMSRRLIWWTSWVKQENPFKTSIPRSLWRKLLRVSVNLIYLLSFYQSNTICHDKHHCRQEHNEVFRQCIVTAASESQDFTESTREKLRFEVWFLVTLELNERGGFEGRTHSNCFQIMPFVFIIVVSLFLVPQ